MKIGKDNVVAILPAPTANEALLEISTTSLVPNYDLSETARDLKRI